MVKAHIRWIVMTLVSLLLISCSGKPTCNEPYILVGNDCCLDKDANKICDRDETNSENKEPTSMQGYVVKEEACPFECCTSGNYIIKECDQDYECKNNKCIELDSDSDGLTDIQEKDFGSNPRVYDTDSDGLSDFQEKQKGTNPSNQNTDNDRYDDGEDNEPQYLNSASIEISIQNKDINWNLVSLSLAALGGTVLSPDMDIANPSVSVQIANVGDDYSSYLSYDIVFYFAGQEMSRTKITKNKIEKNYQKLETSNNQIKAKDVPSIILSALNSGTTDWDVKIENIEYEKFG